MAITITERQHWKNRIQAKLNQRIGFLRASSPALLEVIDEQAKDKVRRALDLDSDFAHYESLEADLKQLATEKENLLEEMALKVFGKELPYNISLRDIRSEISTLEDQEAEEILLEHPLGQQLASLEAEREEMLDAILLATSVPQIIDLWERVTGLITDQPLQPEQPSLLVPEYSYH